MAIQRNSWPLADQNFAALSQVRERSFQFDGFVVKAQFNPERIRSSAAKTDQATIAQRPCFLCQAHRPAEQRALDFRGRYELLVNPYPIFHQHLTIVDYQHRPQLIAGRLPDLLDLARELSGFTIFYNGPQCGASAPDHFHFQAAPRNAMPVDTDAERFLQGKGEILIQSSATSVVAAPPGYLRQLLVFQSTKREELTQLVEQAISFLPQQAEHDEPMLNILANFNNNCWQIMLFPRQKQRPDQYFAEGDDQLLMSPASVEMGGLAILPRYEDFNKISRDDLADILEQVSLDKAIFEEIKQKLAP
ncbi:uncharacterized protein DUF4922 [Mangrovibacterium marinum]|uniref:GDP-D-glucose phosphorylase 1 n=2 Tax=Mangrovibacterium marinum TaxID=1639118 RepID=A0A2T5BZG8_9BACT|nr:uncharacterized protein DUF4922 [Mangrovibacterium marinum]